MYVNRERKVGEGEGGEEEVQSKVGSGSNKVGSEML